MNPNLQLAKGLRQLADRLEAHELPEISGPFYFSVLHARSPDEFRRLAAYWGPEAQLILPKYDNGYPLIKLLTILPGDIHFSLFASADRLCREVVKDTTVQVKEWQLVEPLFGEVNRV